MKNKIKLWLLKTYYSIVGFFLIMKVKNNEKLYFTQNNGKVISTYKYLGNNNFIINTQCMEPTTGVVVFKEYKTLIKYWALGCLFKNKKIKIYQHDE
jgi:hypothetical protein